MAEFPICSVECCGKVASAARGFCVSHYQRWRLYGDPRAGGAFRPRQPPICSVEGCGRKTVGGARGWCTKHYSNWTRNGDPIKAGHTRPLTTRRNPRMEWLVAHQDYRGAECLTWPFFCNEQGYGMVTVNRRARRASRVMCERINGPPPTPKHEAAHSCGKGHEGCVSPEHLRWATRRENVADSMAHGTWVHGETVSQAKLTEADVREIRALRGHVSQRLLAESYGVSKHAISLIMKRKNWAWLV